MKSQGRELIPLIMLFIVFNNLFFFGKTFLAKYQLDHLVLMIANSLFFIVSIIVYMMQKKAMRNSNPNVFVRSVMGGTMIKMGVCVVAVFIYALAFKSSFSKMSVFAAMILYLIYLFVEVKLATKLNKQKNA